MIYYYWYLFVKMKVFNYSELHFAEVTFYKIHTLAVSAKLRQPPGQTQDNFNFGASFLKF